MFIATCHTFQQQRSDKASSDMSFEAEAKLGLAKLSPPVSPHECFFCPGVFFSISELYELRERVCEIKS